MAGADNIKGKGFDKNPQNINRKGRNKLPDLRQVMADILGEEKDGRTALEAIVAKLRQMAAAGNIKAAEVLLARGFGLPKQSIDHSIVSGPQISISKDGNEISLKIKKDEEDQPSSDEIKE